MMRKSDRDLAIDAAKELEGILEQRYNAGGRGLHQKLNSVQHLLPPGVIGHARFIATMRNKLLHEEGFTRLDDPKRFDRALRECRRKLRSGSKRRRPTSVNESGNRPSLEDAGGYRHHGSIRRRLRTAFLGIGLGLFASLILLIAIIVMKHVV